jgi:hypothetical protein
MEPRSWLPRLQKPATCPCPELDQSNSANLMSLFHCLGCTRDPSRPEANIPVSSEGQFLRPGLLAPRLKSNMEDYPLSAVRDCLFNLFVATLYIGGAHSPPTWGRVIPWWQGPTIHYRAFILCDKYHLSFLPLFHCRYGRSDEWAMLTW